MRVMHVFFSDLALHVISDVVYSREMVGGFTLA